MKVGKDGVITVEEGQQAETTVEVVEGMQFDRGYLSPHFVTNQDEQTVELENAYILIYEEKISSAKKLVPLLEAISKASKPLLIIAEDVEGEALATLVVNKMRGILQRLCRQGPRLRRPPQGHAGRPRRADRRQGDLQGPRHRARDRQAHRPGPASRRSIITAENTTIVGGAGKKAEIDGRAEQIRREIDSHRQRIRSREARKSGWRSWPAAWRRSTSAPRPKPK